MKIIKSWLVSNLFLFVGYFVMLYALCSVGSSPSFEGKIWIIILASFCALAASLMFIFGFMQGEAFYEYSYMPITDFEVKLYDNRLIIAHDNHVWSFRDGREKIAKLQKIKIRSSFDIKKKPIGWSLVPYMQKL